jgi:hypothetical protein
MPVIPHSDKLLRIESLQPYVFNGLIRLHPSQTTLIEQLRHFPKADHDDGPDGLHMLWALCSFGSRDGFRTCRVARRPVMMMTITDIQAVRGGARSSVTEDGNEQDS